MTDLDLTRAHAAFEDSTDGTVGLEEEFGILDDQLDLTGRFAELRDAAASDPVLAEAVAGELIDSEIEIRSGRGETFAAAIEAQRDRRRRLFALAGEHGVGLGATATHPWADYRDQHIIDTEHYRRLDAGLGYVAWRNNTFSLHVHVGVRGADRAVAVCDRLRPVLPVLLAVSASSPFLEGRDTRLASARSQTFTRTFPRCGIPDPFGGWQAYADYIDLLVRTGSIVEYTQVWWSIRPHFAFGTVEVRICDAQPSAGESEALAGLIVGCVAQAARDQDDGRPPVDLPGRLIEENLWRAIRYGLDGEMILAGGDVRPTTAVAEDVVAWTEPARRELAIELEPPVRNSAQRQREALEATGDLREVYARTVAETRATYAGSAMSEVWQ